MLAPLLFNSPFSISSHCLSPEDRKTSRFRVLNINQVITVMYKPTLCYTDRDNESSSACRSISLVEKGQVRSYSKFKDKKKYLGVGIVKKDDS